MGRPARLCVVAILVAGTLTACGAEDRRAEDAARHFYDAVSAKDGATACALLAPGTRSELSQSSGKSCAAAVLEEVGSDVGTTHEAQVFDTMAQVALAGDTTFLTRFGDRWLVMAAACTRENDARAYDCSVSGG